MLTPSLAQHLIGLALCGQPASSAGQSQLVLSLLALVAIPALLAVTTAFARIVIMLYFLRAGLGSGTLPPNPVLLGLALLLTWYVMSPVATALSHDVLVPMQAGRLPLDQGLARSESLLRGFMMARLSRQDYSFLARARGFSDDPAHGPFELVASAFALSELRIAFLAGLLIYLPFLVIDVLVYLVLSALGPTTFSQQLFALPVKLLFFVMADGWRLLFEAVSRSYLGGG
jgi:flagellar biosynthetic protein FliP